MAEVVFKNLEEMVPEVEELEQKEVFTKEELRIATKRRTDFEYKLQKKIMNKKDVLNYIEYEIKFIKLTRRRMKRLKMGAISTATINIQRRILRLFDKALMKFEDDLDIWLQFIDYCKKNDVKRTLSKIFPKMIQKHPHNSSVWLLAAKYQIEEENSVRNARSLLQKGLRQNKESSVLWLEYFKMELLHVQKIQKRKETLGIDGIDLKDDNEDGAPQEMEAFLQCKTAEIVYKNAIKQISDDFDFRMKFIEICQEFDNTENVVESILESIEDDFAGSTHLFEIVLKKNTISKKSNEIKTDKMWEEIETNIINDCQTILQANNTSTMWESFLNIMAELLKMSTTSSQTNRRIDCINQIMEKAEEMDMVSCNMALFWLDMVVEVMEDPLKIVEKYHQKFPQSVPIVLKFLALKAEAIDDWEELQSLFQSTLKHFNNEEGLPLWQLYVDIASSLEEDELYNSVLEEVCSNPNKEISHRFLTLYLCWLQEKCGIEKARQFYQKVIKERVPIEFLKKCLEIETVMPNVDIKQLRNIHETIVGFYGNNNADVWLSYIECEKEFNRTDIETPSRMYSRAKNTLQGARNEEFLVKHSEMLMSRRSSAYLE